MENVLLSKKIISVPETLILSVEKTNDNECLERYINVKSKFTRGGVSWIRDGPCTCEELDFSSDNCIN